ncbi:hypothetical protein O5623_17505 [Escherichia coli]|nr:hypothetical protein [Escherichia coli]
MQARPLYIIVTFWGMRTGRLLTVEAVSREFHITQRTAKNILYYIEHEGRNHIRSRRFIQTNRQPAGISCGSRIYRIRRKSLPVQEQNWMFSWNLLPPQQSSPRPLTKFQKLRQWMVSRKQNEQAPLELTEYG